MPDWNQILEELRDNGGKHDIIRRHYLIELNKLTKRNVMIYYSGWLQRPDLGAQTQINYNDQTGFMTVLHELNHDDGLDLILHTPGGEAGATESIVEYLRSVYGTNIRAFVPHLALSGGTVIACACKKIFMGKHSSLGPIDPQMKGGIPAHAVIEEFERASNEVRDDSSKILVWQPILNKYQPAFIVQCEKSIEMTNEMVTEWLRTGMFENEKDASEKSEKVVAQLTDYKRLMSHSRPLPPKRCKEIGLNVHYLEDDKDLQDAVLSVHHACIHTLSGTAAYKIIENHAGKAYIQLAGQQVLPNQVDSNQKKRPQ